MAGLYQVLGVAPRLEKEKESPAVYEDGIGGDGIKQREKGSWRQLEEEDHAKSESG